MAVAADNAIVSLGVEWQPFGVDEWVALPAVPLPARGEPRTVTFDVAGAGSTVTMRQVGREGKRAWGWLCSSCRVATSQRLACLGGDDLHCCWHQVRITVSGNVARNVAPVWDLHTIVAN